jgi:endonuclease/exonuclease/phosphatase family metal-dependent hydrolase
VVLLQEVFERSMVRALEGRLPGYRVVTSTASDPMGFLNASGLVTLTRLPVTEVKFHEFAPLPWRAKFVEALARKGMLGVTVSSESFRGTILNLHLYASRNSSEAHLTWSQWREVLEVVEEYEARGERVLVAGDFNISREEIQSALPGDWTVAQHGPTFDPRHNPYTVQGSNNTPVRHRERRNGTGVRAIDLLLSTSGVEIGVTSRVLENLFLSDHQFIQHTIQVRSPTPWRNATLSAGEGPEDPFGLPGEVGIHGVAWLPIGDLPQNR